MLQRTASRLHQRALYSAQLASKDAATKELTETKLRNGLTVASIDVPNRHSCVSIFVRAGSRFEDPAANLGVSHCLRSASCLTSNKGSGWQATQLLGALGGEFSVAGTREHIVYRLRCGRKVWTDLLTDVVMPNISGRQFYWWELNSVSEAMRNQLAHAQCDANFGVMDAVHEASFRGGISNSIFSKERVIGSHSVDVVKEFWDAHYVPDNLVVVGAGVHHDELCDIVDVLQLEKRSPMPLRPSKFVGSEVRRHAVGEDVSMCLSFSGASLTDQDTIAVAILQYILGPNSYIKYQSERASGISNSIKEKVSEPFSLSSFNINYSDCGALGVYLRTNARCAATLLTAVADETTALADGDIPDQAIEAAKQILKANVLMRVEDADGLVSQVGEQLSLRETYTGPHEVAAKIEAVTTSQVNRIAKKTFGGPRSLAVVGNGLACPYLSDL